MADGSRLVGRLRPYSTTVFGETSALAARLQAINLGQGFPDKDGPQVLKDIAIESIRDGSGNQYPPAHGLPDLRLAIAEHQQRFYGLTVDPDTGVVVTTGASEALGAALLALVEAGDEVIVFEPYFDLYAAIIAMSGATRVTVPLRPPAADDESFTIDIDALRAAITPRTRMILLNSPHNPTGAVAAEDELRGVAQVAIDNDLIVLSDEAYEHLVYSGYRHIPIATLPGMFERTITVGSGGKSFSFTGWKVGWASGPSDLIAAVRVARQHLSYVSGGPFQPAIAAGLRLPDDYFTDFAAALESQRDLLAHGLADAGFKVLPTAGTYFITTDVSPISPRRGRDFCTTMLNELGVATIPLSALADDHERYGSYVRWTFCKQPVVLTAALAKLQDLSALSKLA